MTNFTTEKFEDTADQKQETNLQGEEEITQINWGAEDIDGEREEYRQSILPEPNEKGTPSLRWLDANHQVMSGIERMTETTFPGTTEKILDRQRDQALIRWLESEKDRGPGLEFIKRYEKQIAAGILTPEKAAQVRAIEDPMEALVWLRTHSVSGSMVAATNKK